MTHEEIEDAIPLYAVGALDRSERTAIESHLLTGCPTCHVLVKDYHVVAGLLPSALRPLSPPPRERILARVFERAAQEDSGMAFSDRGGIGGWLNDIMALFISPVWQPAVS